MDTDKYLFWGMASLLFGVIVVAVFWLYKKLFGGKSSVYEDVDAIGTTYKGKYYTFV
jgi:hypothetical protein